MRRLYSMKFGLCLTTAMGLLLAAGQANAQTIVGATDLDDLDLGDSVASSDTNDFLTPPDQEDEQNDVGDLSTEVFENNGVFTYTQLVQPQGVENVSEFNTGFRVDNRGFNGTAGFSFDQTADAGGEGDADDFEIRVDADGTLDFTTPIEDRDPFFGDGDTIRFFFQSTLPPNGLADFNLINGDVGTAQGIQPIPEPASMALLGLGGLALLRRRRSRQVA